MPEPSPLLDRHLDQEVVLDLASPFVVLGRLLEYDHRYLVLTQADVHDLRDTSTNRELYVVDSKRYGIRVNRDRVLIKLEDVVGISPLADVVA